MFKKLIEYFLIDIGNSLNFTTFVQFTKCFFLKLLFNFNGVRNTHLIVEKALYVLLKLSSFMFAALKIEKKIDK